MAASLSRFVPILAWAPAYRPAWLTKDVVAGFTIWGLLIPEMIAYASLAGLPPQAGLYTLLASLVLYAVFGTSKQLVVAGTSASAVLVFSTVTALHPKDSATYATLAAGFIILTGVLFLAAGLLRLGFITQFLSRPVMEGFVFGLAIFVTIRQLPKLFGLEKGEGDTIGGRGGAHPVPIVAVVLMLTTPRARANGPAFVLGWLIGLGVVGVIVLAPAGPGGGAVSRWASDRRSCWSG